MSENNIWYHGGDKYVMALMNSYCSGCASLYYKDGIYAITKYFHQNKTTVFIKDGKAFSDEKLTKPIDEFMLYES